MTFTLNKPGRSLKGTITLAGSKSISNRVLVIRALSQSNFSIDKLANAKDTALLQQLLTNESDIYDAGAAGTTFRFMTAYLAGQAGTQTLTGTERMKQRPIGVLVDALRTLGANIEYLEKEGYPPLSIGEANHFGQTNKLSIPASTSSQYISALLMIAPTLPNGLELSLEGKIVSRPYIEMTLNLMKNFGVDHSWEGKQINIAPQSYQGKDFTVEADWSAASYYYSMAALADEADLQLNGLFRKSTQGDAVLAQLMESFGITTEYNSDGVRITKYLDTKAPEVFEWDFIRCPDLAQTIAVCCAGLGTKGIFTGLETLRIKETDRIAALQQELNKVHAGFEEIIDKKDYFQTMGTVSIPEPPPTFATYEDHRMAMAFAPIAQFGTIQVEEPMVVVKSYPTFWDHLESIGFTVKRGS
ncbi:MAG: 3-phosphoshikimate 1-carboxyvinyltransferase [Chitinophagales bacterium]|nr:3-phosphoshikimate 1-carboxyvinyltransferase [Chitinophagales bacterium]